MILNWIKKIWEVLNRISPTNRNLIIMLLITYIFYSQITQTTQQFVIQRLEQLVSSEKEAEQYTKDTAIEINEQVRLIAERDQDAFDVLLLNYHNNTQSLQGYKYLYLSCLTEAPRTLDTPLLKSQWNSIDYVYYADELTKIHNQSFVQIKNVNEMKQILPKMYYLVKASEAEAITFFAIEGKSQPVGMVVILYKSPTKYSLNYAQKILPLIQRLAILLDYENLNVK